MCQQQTEEDDSDTEGRTNYAESSESADDVAMSTDAGLKLKLQRPLTMKGMQKGTSILYFAL